MTYLLSTTENYRADTENEAINLIETAKATSTVSKYNCVHKERKMKGEVVEEWYKVTITKIWTSEKEPDSNISIQYKQASAFEAEDED